MTIDFLGIGAQKSGTTWLSEHLKPHPGVFIPEVKELHYWDWRQTLGLDWYRAQFAAAPAGTKRGEITPAYGMLAPEVIAQVRAAFPDIRVFFIMRNPVERAWSAASMAMRHADMRPEETSDQWFLDHVNSQGSRRRGDYRACLANWRAAYPADQVLWLLFDELAIDPRAVLRRLADHLGIDAAWFDGIPDEVLRRKVLDGGGQPMPPRVREHLVTLYAPQIAALEDYLGVDLAAWKTANHLPPRSWRQRVAALFG